jgi:CheY-like chemotaxis protein
VKVLIVEDHPSEMKLVDDVLSSAGHAVVAISYAEHALDQIAADRPEIILLDMSLPGMNGLELVMQLKSDPATRDILIVAVTSFPERFSRSRAMDAGCDAYLIKPLSTRTLPQSLIDVISAKANPLH